MLEKLDGKGLLIHHWDTDGICSARLLLGYLSDKKIENKTPILGNYFLTKKELEKYSNYDFVIIADMALPKENILKLATNSKVVIFDHHLQEEILEVEHNNPIIKGESPDKYPSASWIINDYLGNKPNLFAFLGVVGDHEQRIKNNTAFYQMITEFCEQQNLTFDDFLKMVYLLDSNYKLGDKKAVESAPHILLENSNVSNILENTQWNKNLAKLSEEIRRQLEKPYEMIDGTIFKKIDTPYNIISTITRKIAWESGKNTIVLNGGFFKDKDQLYVRSNKNVKPLIKRGKSLGFKCGGKKEVLGAIIPKNKTDCFVEEIIEFLSKNKR